MQHLTSYSLFESETAEPLYPLYLTNGSVSFMGVFPSAEAQVYSQFLKGNLSYYGNDECVLGIQPILPERSPFVYVNSWRQLSVNQGNPDDDPYARVESVYLTRDLLAHPGLFIFAKGSDAMVSLPPAEAFGLLYPNLELPSIGWENI